MMDAIIIGGGAAGLCAACALSEAGRRVLILEKQSRVGRKLLSTGNGRCNLTNLRAAPKAYHGARSAAARMLELCPPKDVLAFFEKLGIPCAPDGEGRVYPMSNQAASVLDALRLFAQEHGCESLTDHPVQAILPGRDGFTVRTPAGSFQGRRVLVCAGGLAAPKLGGCGDGYAMMKALGHEITPRFPAIAALKVPPEDVRGLKGQRAGCVLELLSDNHTLRREEGEILFADDGVSGIAAMQMARLCGEKLRAGKQCALRISLMPGVSTEEAAKRLEERARRLPRRSMEDFLNGIVSRRIGQTLTRLASILPMSRAASTLTRGEIFRLAQLLTAWILPILGTEGFEQAQVTAGGVSLKDFNWDTLESRRVPGLYAAGEMLDVDGDCGGFNLQWAWSSALTAARAIDNSLAKG